MLFVSHSSKDNARLRPLVDALKARGVCVWFDEDEIGAGQPIVGKMNEGLSESDRLLVAWSQTASASKHVPNEVNAFYKQRPEPGFILFMLLDNTPVPVLFDERKHIHLVADISSVVEEIVDWLEGRACRQTSDNVMSAASESSRILERLPRGPRVPFRWITDEIISAYESALDTREKARAIINKANQIREEADPDDPTATFIRPGLLPTFGVVGPYAYWQDVFHEACLNGPRMLAALLLAQPAHLFDSRAQTARARLLQQLHEMNQSGGDVSQDFGKRGSA
jgi:hypothetical protein